MAKILNSDRADRVPRFEELRQVPHHYFSPLLRAPHFPNMVDKVKEVAVGEADRIKALTI